MKKKTLDPKYKNQSPNKCKKITSLPSGSFIGSRDLNKATKRLAGSCQGRVSRKARFSCSSSFDQEILMGYSLYDVAPQPSKMETIHFHPYKKKMNPSKNWPYDNFKNLVLKFLCLAIKFIFLFCLLH